MSRIPSFKNRIFRSINKSKYRYKMTSPVAKEPPPPPRWDYQPSSMIDIAQKLIATSKEVWNRVAQIHPSEATFENAIRPIIEDEHTREIEARIIGFLDDVSPNKDLRDAAREVSLLMAREKIERTSREDVFRVVKAVFNDRATLDPQSRVYIEKLHTEFVYNGLNLPDEQDRLRLKGMRKRMAELSKQYIGNMNNDATGIWLTEDELIGVSQHHIDRWRAAKKDEEHKDQIWISFKRPDLAPFLEYASNSDARRKYWIASENRFKDANGHLQNELVLLRDEVARLLGYRNHAEIKSEERMLKPDLVLNFLHGLRGKLAAKGIEELSGFESLKATAFRQSSETPQGYERKIFAWDRLYYSRLSKEQELKVDNDRVAEYFSLNLIIPKMFVIYEALFGLRFAEVSASVEQGSTWHENVTLYSGSFDKHGERKHPCVVFLANYPPPTPTRPSLLRYRDVVNCFHELGHSVANLVCRAKYAKCTSTTRDFVEIPSILLEHLFEDPNIIRFISCHYEDPSKERKIPEEMIQQLIDGGESNAALPALWLVFQSLFDLKIHSPPKRQDMLDMDLAIEFNSIRRDIVMIEGPESQGEALDFVQGNTHFRAIMGNYDVGYYTYLTSKAFATDIFNSIFAPVQTKARTQNLDEIINSILRKVGRAYRYAVLEPGGRTGDQWTLLVEFLGRKPSFEAFGNLKKFQARNINP
ncbi:metallopeptidase [Phlyctema vagabunda]|uniref:Metallopeptidase n=1 Tax=Phlyctema vagabunda TaxID=108571 RepID=A0ABR4PXP4_9HELO